MKIKPQNTKIVPKKVKIPYKINLAIIKFLKLNKLFVQKLAKLNRLLK